MPAEPIPGRSEDELLALVHGKAAAIRQRRIFFALGASALVLLLAGTGVAIAGNGDGGKSTIRAAGKVPATTVPETTTSTEAPTSTTAGPTSTTSTTTPAAKPPAPTTTTAAPAGLIVTAEAHPVSGAVATDVHFTVHVTDGDGQITGFSFSYGDGSAEPGYTVQDSCSGPPPANRRPRRTDTTYEFVHRYQSAGSFEAKAEVTTGGLCGAIAQEQRTAAATFTATGPG